MMKCINEMKLQFLSRSANEGFARVGLASFAAQLDPTLDELSELKTAISEAVTNAIVHGYKNDFGIVYISAKLYKDGIISIIVRDKGCGIDNVDKAMEPLYTSSDSGDRAGMGFTIMQSFMDKLRVSSAVGKGTRIFMQKKLSTKATR